MSLSQHARGVLFMIGATLCWGSAGMLVRNMQLTSGWEITFWRSLFMTLFVLGVLAVQYRSATWERIRAIGKLGVIVSALWALMYACFILALSHTAVANVLVLTSLSPFTAALLGWRTAIRIIRLGVQRAARTLPRRHRRQNRRRRSLN